MIRLNISKLGWIDSSCYEPNLFRGVLGFG